MGLVPSAPGAAPWGADPAAWLAALPGDPGRVSSLQADYAQRQAKLWADLLARGGGGAPPAAAPEPPGAGDKRFAAAEWRDIPYYDYLKQSYLLASGYLGELVESVAAEPHAKKGCASRCAS